ncbi:hypothetical protein OpiT1DRAFT_01822 [Opitutaceae bacterium TAV1]|nr:hypothetical protein OpiT1DRAFT_01822 [Opitutaceae bacterium TAV1]
MRFSPSRFSPSLLVIALFLTPVSSAQAVAPDLQTAINALADAPAGTTFTLPSGTHRLPHAGLRIHGLRDVTIEGNGAVRLLATDPQGTGVSVQDCRNVTFRGFTLDFDPLPFTQATITHVNPERRSIDFALHDGYPDLREPASQTAVLRARIHLFHATEHRWKPGAPDYAAASVIRTGSRTGRASFSTADGMRWFSPGDRIAIATLSGNAIRISQNCSGLLWEDITIQASPFVAIALRSNEDSGTWRRIKILPGPPPPGATQPRLLSSNADGFNSAYVRRGPVIEDCEFAYLGDDSINLHGAMLPVAQWLTEDVSSTAQAPAQFLSILAARNNRVDLLSRPGDTIRFLRSPDYRIVATRRISSVTRIEMDAAQWVPFALKLWGPSSARPKPETISVFQITLEPADKTDAAGNTPDANLAETSGLFVDFPALAAPGYVIRNNYFHDHRARSLRIMASNGLISGNRIERIKQVGISIGPEYAFWREAGWVSDVVIENNILRDIAEGANAWSPAAYTLGAISTMARMDLPKQGKPPGPYYPGNRNITIRGNLIENCPLDAIHIVATDTDTLKIEDNKISNTATLDPAEKQRAGREHGMSVGTGIKIVP